MPSKWTFTLKPVQKLFQQEMNGGAWLDPMAGFNSPAGVTNDINPDAPTDYHLDSLEFLKLFADESQDGVIWDPPYSAAMAKKHYGLEYEGGFIAFGKYQMQVRRELVRVLKPGGKAICFAWNSAGLGINPYRHMQRRGKRVHGKSRPIMKLYRLLILTHGLFRPDTMVTCQRKVQTTLYRSEMNDSETQTRSEGK